MALLNDYAPTTLPSFFISSVDDILLLCFENISNLFNLLGNYYA